MTKAKIFISCGQKTKIELSYGKRIAKYLRERGFELYLAEEVHSTEALTENIFRNLKNSEYFLAYNPERKDSSIGSLFVQQEIAIAAFLKLPMLLFYEGNIDLKEGVAAYIKEKNIEVKSSKDILKKVKELTKSWNPHAKNQFQLIFGNHHPKFKFQTPDGKDIILPDGSPHLADWFHIIVHNQSNKNAKNCMAHITSIKNKVSGKLVFGVNDYKPELYWAGASRVSVDIPAEGKRDLDAFHYDYPSELIVFNHLSFSSAYRYPKLPKGRYEINYLISCDNLPPAYFKLEIIFTRGSLKHKGTQIFETQEGGA